MKAALGQIGMEGEGEERQMRGAFFDRQLDHFGFRCRLG